MRESEEEHGKGLQIGNFLLGLEEEGDGARYMVLRTVVGNWSVRWREDTAMFGTMLNAMAAATENEGAKKYFGILFMAMFIVCTYAHDLESLARRKDTPFLEGIARLYQEELEYLATLDKQDATEEEDLDALEEAVRMSDLQEEMERKI